MIWKAVCDAPSCHVALRDQDLVSDLDIARVAGKVRACGVNHGRVGIEAGYGAGGHDAGGGERDHADGGAQFDHTVGGPEEAGDQSQFVAFVVSPQQRAQDLRGPMVEIHRDVEAAEVDEVLGHVRSGGIMGPQRAPMSMKRV